MIFHNLFAYLSLIYLFCKVDTGVRVCVSVVFVVFFSVLSGHIIVIYFM